MNPKAELISRKSYEYKRGLFIPQRNDALMWLLTCLTLTMSLLMCINILWFELCISSYFKVCSMVWGMFRYIHIAIKYMVIVKHVNLF